MRRPVMFGWPIWRLDSLLCVFLHVLDRSSPIHSPQLKISIDEYQEMLCSSSGSWLQSPTALPLFMSSRPVPFPTHFLPF
jgi:hypothetical protein